MEKTAKTPNYTTEQVARIVSAYTVAPSEATVKTLAEELGKSTRSIVAKLARQGVYKAKEYKTKTGETVVKKDETADAIGAVLNLKENDIESLTKANKSALKAIWAALANSVPAEAVPAETA
jgi:hypothetical protein